jgi:uncharacterized repeat protein (TIGR01451 family)
MSLIRNAAALLLPILAAPVGLKAADTEVVSPATVDAARIDTSTDAVAAVQTTLVAEVREESAGSSGNPVRYFVPATVLEQGREVFYTVRIKNPGAQFANDVVVVQRIPQNTSYVPNSAAGPGAEIGVSADGGQSFGVEGRLTFTDPTGLARPATAQDYTHIRWHLRNPLAPGAVALARFRAVFR